jgi:hypothetical protein
MNPRFFNQLLNIKTIRQERDHFPLQELYRSPSLIKESKESGV